MPAKAEEKMTEQEKQTPENFCKNVANYFFPDDPAVARLFEQYLMTGRSDDTTTLKVAMEKKGVAETISIVDLYGHASIDVPQDGSTRYVMTHDLNGCTASATFGETPNGTRIAQMTHFPPFMRKRQEQNITDLKTKMPAGARTVNVLFHDAKRASHIPELDAHLQEAFPGSITTAVPYTPDTSRPDNGIFILKIPPKSSGDSMSYHGNKTHGEINL